MDPLPSWLTTLLAIGEREDDTGEVRLQQRALVAMGLAMATAAVPWAALCLVFGLATQAVVPLGYVGLTAVNLGLYRSHKRFDLARTFQVGISVVLPFLFQWAAGGLAATGAVMVWGLVPVVGSLTFSDIRQAGLWLGLFGALCAVSLGVEPIVSGWSALDLGAQGQASALVLNLVASSGLVFGLTVFLLERRDRAHRAMQHAYGRMERMNAELEEVVARRTAELARALAENEAVISHLGEGLVAVDATGVLQSANPAFQRLLGFDESPVGQHCSDVLPPQVVAIGRRCRETGQTGQVEFALDDGRHFAAVASPVDNEGLQVGCVLLLRDVTIQKEIDRMKTEFTATVSHELRTPLTSVLGFAKLIRNKLDRQIAPHVPESDRRAFKAMQQTRTNIDVIIEEGERLTKLINDVLDIAKMESGEMAFADDEIDPAVLVDRSLAATSALFPETSTVSIRRQIAPSLPALRGDADRLLQVLINLISNAAKFTESGSVTVAVGPEDDRSVAFSVIDTGSGIPPAQRDRVFEKFRQVDGAQAVGGARGTGLGLPICKQIVEAHGGHISLESTEGQGSCFRFTLPVPSR